MDIENNYRTGSGRIIKQYIPYNAEEEPPKWRWSKKAKRKNKKKVKRLPTSSKLRTNDIKKLKTTEKKIIKKKKCSSIIKHRRRIFPQVIRNSVCSRQRWSCNCCKNLLGECFIIDHVVPLCYGGSNDINNLQSICPSCDKFKTGYLDYKVIKNIANDGMITPQQVLNLQEEYFNKIMGGNTNQNSNLFSLNSNNGNSNVITVDIFGIKITIPSSVISRT